MVTGSRVSTYEIFKAKPGADSIPIEDPGASVEFVDLYNAGVNLAWDEKYDSAISAFRRCCDVAPPDFAYGYERLGRTYLKMEQYDSARSNLQRALAIDDWCVYSHLELGRILARDQSYDSAIRELRAVVAYAPDCMEGYTDLSEVLIQANRLATSESVLVACANRFAGAADPALRLARVRRLSGNVGSAERGLAEFVARYPDHRDARSLLDSIGCLRRSAGPGN